MARRGHRARRTVNSIAQLEWRDVINAYGPIEVLDDEQVQIIIDGALTILETKGMRFLEPGVERASPAQASTSTRKR